MKLGRSENNWHSNIIEWTGRNIEDGPGTADRCKWGEMVAY